MTGTVGTPLLWAGFVGLVIVLLALDLGVFHRKDKVVSAREAVVWTMVWIGVALLFNGLIFWRFGHQPGVEFLTGYLIEKSLSVDNLFVFLIIFSALRVPAEYQHRVLYWGILTALVLRAAMIVGGTALMSRFHWLIYVFGAFLIITGIRLFFKGEEEAPHPEKSQAFRILRRVIPATSQFHGHAFFAWEAGRRVATPLFLALALIEISDVVFALDSIPAIFGVTLDPFIVFTSNIFAILGLRSLFFAVAQLMRRFEYLHYGLAAVLVFIGLKMSVSGFFHVNEVVSLVVVVALLGGAMGYSFLRTRQEGESQPGREP